MFRMGIRSANEKILNTAENRFNTIEPARYFLYGAAKRLSTFQKSFIVDDYAITCKYNINFPRIPILQDY
jgi:hypothetical protein